MSMKQQSNPTAVIQDGTYSSIAEEEAKESISLVDKVRTIPTYHSLPRHHMMMPHTHILLVFYRTRMR